MLAVTMGKPHTLTAAIAKEIKLCSPGLAAADRPYVKNIRTMKRKYSFDAFVVHNPAHRKHLIDTAALAGNHYTREDLNTFLSAFLYLAMHVNRIAYLEVWYLALKILTLNGV